MFHVHYMITDPPMEQAAQLDAQLVADYMWPHFEAAGTNGIQVQLEQPIQMDIDEEPAVIQPGLHNLAQPLTNPFM